MEIVKIDGTGTDIIRFSNRKEYDAWLSDKSRAVQNKAKKFDEYYNKIPVVLVAETDTSQDGTASYTHLFLDADTREFIF